MASQSHKFETKPEPSYLQDASDEELVVLTKTGNLKAFDEIVRRYQREISCTLFRICPNPSELEDLVQESLVKAYTKIETWKPQASLKAWLKKIAINTGYDYFRKKKRISSHQEDLEYYTSLVEEDRTRHFEIATTSWQSTEAVQHILSNLPPDDRLLLTLQYLEEMPLRDICKQTGWSLPKVKVKSFRARNRLKSILSQHGYE